MGEAQLGAYAEKARVKGPLAAEAARQHLHPKRNGRCHRGYTAMLAVMALEDHGLKPASGPVVVTVPPMALARLRLRCLASSAMTSSPRPAALQRTTI